MWNSEEGYRCIVKVNLMLVKNAGSMVKCSVIKGQLINGQHHASQLPQYVFTSAEGFRMCDKTKPLLIGQSHRQVGANINYGIHPLFHSLILWKLT